MLSENRLSQSPQRHHALAQQGTLSTPRVVPGCKTRSQKAASPQSVFSVLTLTLPAAQPRAGGSRWHSWIALVASDQAGAALRFKGAPPSQGLNRTRAECTWQLMQCVLTKVFCLLRWHLSVPSNEYSLCKGTQPLKVQLCFSESSCLRGSLHE